MQKKLNVFYNIFGMVRKRVNSTIGPPVVALYLFSGKKKKSAGGFYPPPLLMLPPSSSREAPRGFHQPKTGEGSLWGPGEYDSLHEQKTVLGREIISQL